MSNLQKAKKLKYGPDYKSDKSINAYYDEVERNLKERPKLRKQAEGINLTDGYTYDVINECHI